MAPDRNLHRGIHTTEKGVDIFTMVYQFGPGIWLANWTLRWGRMIGTNLRLKDPIFDEQRLH